MSGKMGMEDAAEANTSVGDCEAWGLTSAQRLRYHTRLSRYHADRASATFDRAARLGRIAMRCAVVSLGLLLASFALHLLG